MAQKTEGKEKYKSISQMNIDAKILKKILPNRIQHITVKIIHCDGYGADIKCTAKVSGF